MVSIANSGSIHRKQTLFFFRIVVFGTFVHSVPVCLEHFVFVHQSNRMEILLQQLRATLRTPLADPLTPETIVV